MKVALTPQASADLKDIARWIAREQPGRARMFVAELRGKCNGLSRQPKRFPVVRQLGGYSLRKRVHGAYLIFYHLGNEQVEVIRILHGARNWAGDPDMLG